MKNKMSVPLKNSRSQRGAAMVTTLFVGTLLLTGSFAMMIAVGANSQNTTDVLSETKAYYAAESGMQASINVLRNKGAQNKGIPYSQAVSNPDLSPWLGSSQPLVGTDASYTIAVSDPDHSADPVVYSTVGTFQQADGTYAATRVYGSGADTLTFSFNNYTSSSSGVTQPLSNTQMGSLQVQKAGSGATLPNGTKLNFRIDFTITAPRAAIKTIRGYIDENGNITVLNPYQVLGSGLTAASAAATIPVAPSDTAAHTVAATASMEVIEPYRLKILSTGFGPNSARKQFEGIIQKNFFNDFPSGYALSLVGNPNCDASNTTFKVGTSNNMDIVGGSSPSVGTSSSSILNIVTGAHTNGTMTPAPEVMSNDTPAWMQSASQMDLLIRQLRKTAQDSGRYFTTSNPPSNFGDYATGTGLTFCEGSCNLGNQNGGGILVVTGTFSSSGNPKFNGLILAVGPFVSNQNPGGIVRSGGGQEVFTGNIVIAPYDPNNLAAGFGCPYYNQQGGAGDTVNSDLSVNVAADGTQAISNFMLGIAEK